MDQSVALLIVQMPTPMLISLENPGQVEIIRCMPGFRLCRGRGAVLLRWTMDTPAYLAGFTATEQEYLALEVLSDLRILKGPGRMLRTCVMSN